VNFRISLVQQPLVWQDAVANRAHFGEVLRPLAGTTDLVVLPEMFTSGFTMKAEKYAELAAGETRAWLLAQAATLDAMVGGSVAVNDRGRFYNRFMLATPDGDVHVYDKRHLFRLGGEHRSYSAGTHALLVEWRGVRLCPLVCYDLRFPVFSRRRPELDYDLVLYVASWPEPRTDAWSALLRARAIENQAFCVGVNRVGEDGGGKQYIGASVALDYLGHPLLDLGAHAAVGTVALDLEALREWRDKFPAHLDADAFTLES
jgi:predicted amidohydrolase